MIPWTGRTFGASCAVNFAPKADKAGVRQRLVFLAVVAAVALTPFNLAAQAIDLGNGLTLEDGEISAVDMIEAAARANNHFCMVVIGNPGTMAPTIGNVALSSKVAGGYSGTAEITATNSSYRASVIAPAGFISSPNLPGPVSFEADFSGSGATNFSNVPALYEVKIKKGLTSISADLTATIQGGAFTAGYYQAELTLRCE